MIFKLENTIEMRPPSSGQGTMDVEIYLPTSLPFLLFISDLLLLQLRQEGRVGLHLIGGVWR
jgi:hypothetical protein